MLVSVRLAGAGDDLELGIQPARGKDDVNVDGIGGSGGNQTAGALNAGLAKHGFVGGVTHNTQPFFGQVADNAAIFINDDERNWPPRQFLRGLLAHPSRSAENVVSGKPVDFAVHFAPAQQLSDFEF